ARGSLRFGAGAAQSRRRKTRNGADRHCTRRLHRCADARPRRRTGAMIMTKWMRRGVALIALAAGLAAPGVALAQTCAGVESRVNSATSQLQGAVTSHITTRTSAMVAQEIYQRQRLLSAMHVLVRQDAVSSEQVTNADRAANEALANVIIEQSVND